MGKTPAQQNRLKAKQQGMSHDSIKEQQAKEIREQKKLANKDINFGDRKSTRLNSSHSQQSRMPSSA